MFTIAGIKRGWYGKKNISYIASTVTIGFEKEVIVF